MSCKQEDFDYIIKRNDTFPPISYVVPDCEGIDLSQEGLSVQVSMWANSNLASSLGSADTNIKFKNNYNISCVEINNHIIVKKYNSFEYLKVVSVNYDSIEVLRAQLGSSARVWEKSNQLKIIKLFDVEGEKKISYNDSINLNGEKENNVSLQELIYNWGESDTSKPGEYFLEFKLIKNNGSTIEWSKKFPSKKEGIKIQIVDNNLEV